MRSFRSLLLSLLIASPAIAAGVKINAGASAHSKATVPTHPTADVPLNHPAAPQPTPPAAPVLSWDDAVRLTRQQNADLHASQATVEQQTANVKVAWGNFLPQVDATITAQKSNTIDVADADANSARVNLTENLFNGFGDKARIDQAKRQLDNARAAYDLTASQVSAQLKEAFQSLVIAERSVKLSDDIVQRRQTNLDIVTLRFEGGRENKGSVLLSQANLNQSKLDRLQAADAVEAAKVTIARVIGEDRFPFGDVSGEVPVTVPPLQVDFEGLAANAPEMREAVATEQAAREGVRIARSGFFPTLTFTANAGRFGSTFFPQTDQGVVALGLTIPLFNGGETYYGVRAAEAVATNAEAARMTALRAKIVAIRSAYNTYVEAVEQENVAQSFVTAAETRAEIARSQYNVGLITFQDWDLIEDDLVTRQRAALTSQTNRVNAEAAWEQSQGTGLFK